MPAMSPRIATLNPGGDDGWGVFYAARARVAAGEAITELTIGEHDIRTDPGILAAMAASASGGHTGYASVPGIPALRDAVAQRITSRTGVPTSRDNVLITPGGQAGLFAAHLTCVPPQGSALYIDPYYATYPGTLRAAGTCPVPLSTLAEENFLPDPTALDQLAQQTRAASLLINSPNNPTGTIYPADTLRGISEVCQRHDMWLISDEVYDTQIWDGAHLSPRALPGMADRTVVIGSMSKSHAMTGSRVGWIVAPAQVIDALADLAVTTTYGVPGYIQDAAVYALEQGTALEQHISAPFARRRALAHDVLKQQNIVRLIPSGGAMYLFLDIRATGLSGTDFASALLDRHAIAVMPGESFGASAAGHIRVAMTVKDKAFATALHHLCRFAADCARDATQQMPPT